MIRKTAFGLSGSALGIRIRIQERQTHADICGFESETLLISKKSFIIIIVANPY